MKAVLLSVRPEWCEKEASSEKTLEIRKSRPKMKTPFKCYIYQTKRKWPYKRLKKLSSFEWARAVIAGQGKVIGEFVCDDVSLLTKAHYGYIEKCACISREQIKKYIGLSDDQELDYSDGLYGWHISELKVFDEPRQLREFRKPCKKDESCFTCDKSGYNSDMHIECFNTITRPPQSWCYVEEM